MSVINVESKEEFEQLIHEYPYVMVDFYADWCGGCEMLAPVFEQASKEYEGRVVFAKVSLDQGADLESAYEIRSLPTLMFFKNAKPVIHTAGYRDSYTLGRIIEAGLSKES